MRVRRGLALLAATAAMMSTLVAPAAAADEFPYQLTIQGATPARGTT